LVSPQAEGGKVYEALHRAAHQIAELRAEHRCRGDPWFRVSPDWERTTKMDNDEVTMRFLEFKSKLIIMKG
jgi:hypothetical protein